MAFWLDNAAKALTPNGKPSRRRLLGRLGGSFVAAVAAVRLKAKTAEGACPFHPIEGACRQFCNQISDPILRERCKEESTRCEGLCYECGPRRTNPNRTFCPGSNTCCNANQSCVTGACCATALVCGAVCCQAGQVCSPAGACCTPDNTAACAGRCNVTVMNNCGQMVMCGACTSGTCCNGVCVGVCAINQLPTTTCTCGPTCCPATCRCLEDSDGRARCFATGPQGVACGSSSECPMGQACQIDVGRCVPLCST